MLANSKPSIAILHYAAPPTVGGVESTIAAHARLFADHGYAVKVIAGRGEPFDPRVPVQTIPTIDSRHSFVVEVNQKLVNGIVPDDFYPLTYAINHGLQEAFADVDVCIAHNVLTLHKNLALTTALRQVAQTRKLRLIAWSHDFAWQDPVYRDEIHSGPPWDLMRQAWDGVKYVVVSETRRKELAVLLTLPEQDIAVVPPGLDAFEFLQVSDQVAMWMRDLKLLDAAPLLLLPARVTRRKNIELAIEIIAALRDRGHVSKLVIMGPLGPHNPANAIYLDELRDLRRTRGVEDAVIFLQEQGMVNDAARRGVYSLADALLFPSAREGFGIPILEAGIAHLPIFCADIAPFRESAGEWANYFALDEAPAVIASRIVDTLARDTRYQLKRRVVRDYTWPRIFAERIEPLLK
jgi:glycosyltransferase involved in cell wall biosynthesis